MADHIKHLKRHRNVLYGFAAMLLLVQIVAFIVLSSQVSQIRTSQTNFEESMKSSVEDLRQEDQYKINEITQEITRQKTDVQQRLAEQQQSLDSQIRVLSASQGDFSPIINSVIQAVVSVGTDKSAGTGFIVHSSGYVITNYHVVQGGQYIKIITYDNRMIVATLIGFNATSDLALLKVEGVFAHLDFAQPNTTEIGDKVIAIGNPLGLSFTVTEGIVSALDREGPNGLKEYIQTDVTLNPGNSGGPLIDRQGKVIGINNFKLGNAEGLGFALRAHVVNDFITKFIPA